MSKIPDHLHKYKKTDIGSNDKEYLVFRCLKPACSHYIPVKVAEGKLCECNRCHNPMILTKKAMILTLPHCPNCTKKKKDVDDISKIAEFLSKTGS